MVGPGKGWGGDPTSCKVLSSSIATWDNTVTLVTLCSVGSKVLVGVGVEGIVFPRVRPGGSPGVPSLLSSLSWGSGLW